MVTAILDTGDTAWMLVSTALVMLMTVPGLALFYGGLVKRETVLNTLFLSFSAYAIVSIIWFIYGYPMVLAQISTDLSALQVTSSSTTL
jgi:Amt family ammonium transporter